MRSDDTLFSQYQLYAVLRSQEEALVKAVDEIPAKALLESDADSLIEPLVRRFALEVPRLLEEKKYAEQTEVEIDVTGDIRFLPPLDGRRVRVKDSVSAFRRCPLHRIKPRGAHRRLHAGLLTPLAKR